MTVEAKASLKAYVENSWNDLLEKCTACGRCVEVCPTVPFAPGLGDAPAPEVVGGVLRFMRGEDPIATPSGTWVKQCNGCGDCIPACPEGINPRRMLQLANTELARRTNPTPHLFQKMARAVRIMVAMQVVPEDAARLLKPKKARDVDVVFYAGCNPVRTPQLIFNAMTVLDALGVDYEVIGGPGACCGIVATKWEGDLEKGGKVSEQTLHRFGSFKPEKVLNWCPSCQMHLDETLKGYREVNFDFDHITRFLIEHEEQLRQLFTTPLNMRVLVHTHVGQHQVGQDVVRLMRAIPGLTILDEAEEPGYMCGASGSERSPELKAHVRQQTIAAAKRADVDAIVSLYHACHRQLAADGHKHGFQVYNFTDMLVRAMGLEPYEDTFTQFRGRTDWRQMVDEASPLLEANGIDIDREELAEVLPELFAMTEWKGGLCRFAPEA